jgi:hypothetical protein
MGVRRKSIRIYGHERQFLVEIYLLKKIPIDQYEVRQADLHRLGQEWRAHCQCTESDQEILHYMRTQRKSGLWVRFDGVHQSAPVLPKLPAEHMEVLIDIYYEHLITFDNGSDVLAYEPEIAKMVETEFEHRTMRRVPARQLIGILTAVRKRGLLPKVRDHEKRGDPGIGFSDIDDVAE